MQNNKQHTEFIRHLKQQPRLGNNGNGLGNFFKNLLNTANDINTAFNIITNNVGNVVSSIQAQVDTVTNLVGEMVKQQAVVLDQVDANQKYLTGLNKKLAIDRKLTDALKAQVSMASAFEKRNMSLNKTFGTTVAESSKMSAALAIQAKRYGISHKQAIQFASSIESITSAISLETLALDENDNKYVNKQKKRIKSIKENYAGLELTQKVLVTNMKLDAKAAEEFSYYATQRGKNAKDQLLMTNAIAEKMDEELGTQNSFKVITEEIGKSSASTQLQFGRIAGSLELAAIKGRNLGLSLDQVAGIGNKMLNIESSIGDELEYQLLSGRRLIGNETARADLKGKSLTNAFREAALMGDAGKQADALNAILEQEGDTLTNNVLARQQMAKLLGMEENQLSRALQKKKLLEELGADEKLFELGGKDFNAAIQNLKKSGQATDAQIKEAMRLKDTRSTEEKMDEARDVQEDIKIGTFLQIDQTTKLVENSIKSVNLMKDMARAQDISTTDLEGLGAAQLGINAFTAIQSVINDAKTLKLSEGGSAEDFLAINGKLVKYRKDDLVIGGTFGGRRQEVINQVTGNASGGGGGGGMSPEQFAQAIVSAMQYAKFSVAVDDVAAMMRNA